MTMLDKVIRKYGFENWRTVLVARLYQIFRGK